MIGGAKGIGLGIDLGLVNQYNRTGSQSYIEPEVLDSLVGVWSAYGMTNDSPNRSTIKNKLSNKGGDFVISNAAFKLNSGFGKYSADFESFDRAVNISQKQHNKATISLNGRLCNHTAIEIDEMKVNIIGNVTELIYWYIANPDDTTRSEIRLTSGINTLPKSYAKDDGQTYNIGFAYISGDSEITIEQIPSFEGAFVTDGIDDLITSTKTAEEMGITDEVTVVSMIHQINANKNFTTTNNLRNKNRVIGRNTVTNIGKTGIYGWYKKDIQGTTATLIDNILGDKNDYTGHYTESTNSVANSKFYVTGYAVENGFTELSSVAWYWTIIANKVLTTDQINQVIAYFNLDRTLKPDILCNVKKQGITNENHAEFGDRLIDFSGNGRDIQLNNIAWDGDSGIGKYNYPNWKVNVTQGNKYARIVYYDSINGTYSANFKGITDLYKSYGLSIEIRVNRANTVDFHSIKEDGIYTMTPPDDTTSIDIRFAGENVYNASCDITITQIPSHAGALCLDGVNDFGKVTGMSIYKDYTFIIEREFLNETFPNQVCLVSKSKVASEIENGGAFIVDNISVNSIINPYSFYKTTSLPGLNTFDRQIVFQSKYKYLDKDIAAGTATDSDTLWLGTFRDNDSRFFNGAIYSLMSFPYSMSKFLIERQLKKHKLGTLYPNMVEFRPVIKKDDRIKSIKYYIDDKTANIGQYYPIGTGLGIAVETVQPYMVKSLKVNGVNTIPNADYKGFNARLDSKSPQKITMDIQVDTNLIQWNPIITSTVELTTAPTFAIRGTSTLLKPGDWIPKNSEIWVIVTMNNLIDELRKFSFNGTFINIPSSSYNPDTGKYGFPFVIDNESTQNINLTIDEYIRFEDIVQPYPVLLRFNDENGNEVSWGGKFRVGSTITRIGSFYENNLIDGLYIVHNPKLNGNNLITPTHVVEKSMVFTCDTEYLLDNNEPKCILSPSRLRIPNSSYKILGYIPDISGHGNHGVIHNSAYAGTSGVNEDGSYQFDGVDDFVSIPTLSSGGKQVLMKVNWQSAVNTAVIYDQRTRGGFAILNGDTTPDGTSIIAYEGRNIGGSTYIDGVLNKYIYASQLKDITHNITAICSPNNGVGNLSPLIGTSYLNVSYTKMSLYDFMLFDNISTDDKIKELNEYVGIEAKVELPPYYWDAYGKTNLDADKATIQQRGVAVGDYDLTNYNHAYDKMSSYGGYEFAKFDNTLDWYNTEGNDSVEVVSRNGHSITLKRLTGSNFWYFQNSTFRGLISNVIPFKVNSNKNIAVIWDVHGLSISEGKDKSVRVQELVLNPNEDNYTNLKTLNEEELAQIDISTNSLYYLLWFDLSTLAVNEEVTIEMLPLYPNGLVYDGITDYSKNANIPALDDFTAIIKREWLKKQGCPLIKGSKVYEGGNGNALLLEWDKAYNFVFYKRTDIMEGELPDNISFITPTNYNGNVITRGSEQDTNGICIAGDGNAGFANMVFYKLILYPKTIPLLQINFLKNLMERDEIIDLNNKIFIQE